MDKSHPYLRRYIGAFVRCNFPHLSLDQNQPSAHEHYALIVGARWDEDLEMRIFTVVHSSKELEAISRSKPAPNDGSFKSLVAELTKKSYINEDETRVALNDRTDRIVNPQQVVLLPESKEFFHDLEHGREIEILSRISGHDVVAIRAKMKRPPNGVALTFFRMNKEFARVQEDFLIIPDDTAVKPKHRKRRDRSRKPNV